jgi:hypothetical protein
MTNSVLNPFVPCHATIYLDGNGRVSTYCMRERGHADESVTGFPGGHSIVNAPPEPAAKESTSDQTA